MAKFLVLAHLTNDGAKGFLKDGAAGRQAAVTKAYVEAGGKVEAWYSATGKYNVAAIVDIDAASNTALLLTIQAAGGIDDVEAVPLIASADLDTALRKGSSYRPAA